MLLFSLGGRRDYDKSEVNSKSKKESAKRREGTKRLEMRQRLDLSQFRSFVKYRAVSFVRKCWSKEGNVVLGLRKIPFSFVCSKVLFERKGTRGVLGLQFSQKKDRGDASTPETQKKVESLYKEGTDDGKRKSKWRLACKLLRKQRVEEAHTP